MEWMDYREKLGIGFSDQNKVEYFMVKMFNLLDDIVDTMRCQIDEEEYFAFCNMTGTPMYHGELYGDGYKIIVGDLHRNDRSLEMFLAYYMAFVNCQKDKEHKKWTRENFKNVVCNMLRDSHIPYELLEDKDGAFVFPKGAEEMDSALVSQPLAWLSCYPKAHTAFVKALKSYAEVTSDTASDVADKFRKALETFLREFFGNEVSLEKNKAEYGRYLKSQGVPSEISGNFETLLQMYANFMNGYAKHQDATELNVLEYIMYQTGNIIRLLITLKKEEV